MVKIERTYPRYCCHSCGRRNSEILPVWVIKVGIPSIDGSVQITSISLCNDCMKALQTKIGEVIPD